MVAWGRWVLEASDPDKLEMGSRRERSYRPKAEWVRGRACDVIGLENGDSEIEKKENDNVGIEIVEDDDAKLPSKIFLIELSLKLNYYTLFNNFTNN